MFKEYWGPKEKKNTESSGTTSKIVKLLNVCFMLRIKEHLIFENNKDHH